MAEGRVSDISPVAVVRNWQDRVKKELYQSKQWSEKWGFMAHEDSSSGRGDSVDTFIASANGCRSTVALNLKDAVKQQNLQSQDSIDGFLHQYLMKAGGPAMRAYPKQEFLKPTLSSHAVGWGKNLERFGPLSLRLR